MRRIIFVKLFASVQTILALPGSQSLNISYHTSNQGPPTGDGEHQYCTPQAPVLGPHPEEDTPDAFQKYDAFHNISVQALVPKGYTLEVLDSSGSIANDLGFLDFKVLEAYDPDICASLCSERPVCGSFGIYFERAPLYEPDSTAGCPNPPSTTNIKCVLWNAPVIQQAVTAEREIREQFEVVIAGSNLYNKKAGVADLTDLGFVTRLDADSNAVFEVPNEPTANYNTLIRRDILVYGASNPWYDKWWHAQFPSYMPEVCGRVCSAATEAPRHEHPFTNGATPVCNMIVAYELRTTPDSLPEFDTKPRPKMMICEIYSSVWSSRYQTGQRVHDTTFRESLMLQPALVSVYDRGNYPAPPICAMEECGEDYYAGGDCGGWGEGHC